MLVEVTDCTQQETTVVTELADASVTPCAEQSTDGARSVIVVYCQRLNFTVSGRSLGAATDSAASPLCEIHIAVLLHAHAELTLALFGDKFFTPLGPVLRLISRATFFRAMIVLRFYAESVTQIVNAAIILIAVLETDQSRPLPMHPKPSQTLREMVFAIKTNDSVAGTFDTASTPPVADAFPATNPHENASLRIVGEKRLQFFDR
jgi:hypothetical protein